MILERFGMLSVGIFRLLLRFGNAEAVGLKMKILKLCHVRKLIFKPSYSFITSFPLFEVPKTL